MRSAAPLLLLGACLLLPALLPAAPGAHGSQEPASGPAAAVNGSRLPAEPAAAPGNHSGAQLSPLPALLRDLSALKAAVIGACALTAALIACLLLRVFRSGKRIKKTRKYDIITTPAERVEMAPLNEEDDEDEDSTVFDVKYSSSSHAVSLMSGYPGFADMSWVNIIVLPDVTVSIKGHQAQLGDLGGCCQLLHAFPKLTHKVIEHPGGKQWWVLIAILVEVPVVLLGDDVKQLNASAFSWIVNVIGM
ncbi:hypothetical protein Q9233_010746 [Columba guinea]|nr:hypothetical protein Q9233_010746 [Columba guinea]